MANNDRINEAYYGTIFDENTHRLARERVHWICKNAVGCQVLDIGCSQGISSILLARSGFDVTAIDIESSAIEYAARELEQEEKEVMDKVKLIHANALTYDFGREKFDTVIAAEIIEHLVRQDLLYEKIFDVLRVHGRVIITTPFGIMDYHDHKKTYCLSLLLKELHPYFLVQQVHIIGKWICLTAERRDKAANSELTHVELNHMEQAENKFLVIERHLLDMNKQCMEKNKALSDKIELLEKGQGRCDNL